jgi:hypothetical protein
MRGPQVFRPRAYRAPAGQPEMRRARAEARPQYAAAAAGARATATPFNLYEDLLGYALWPADYAERFWAHGYSDILQTSIKQGDSGTCSAQAKEQAARPLDRIEQVIELTEAQRQKRADVRTAVHEAVERGKAACLDAVPNTPAERLKAMMDALWALNDAILLFRTPLDAFHASLTDEQKAQLQRLAAGATVGGPATSVCSHAANDLPIDMGSIQPTPERREGLEMLQGLAAELSKYIADACPQETPPTPVARLDAAGNRVQALLYAAVNLEPAIQAFSSQPSGERR